MGMGLILRTIRDGEPRTATSTFTQLLSSEKKTEKRPKMTMGMGLFISLLLLFAVVFSVWGGRWYFDLPLRVATVSLIYFFSLFFFFLLVSCGVCVFLILPVVVGESVKKPFFVVVKIWT